MLSLCYFQLNMGFHRFTNHQNLSVFTFYTASQLFGNVVAPLIYHLHISTLHIQQMKSCWQYWLNGLIKFVCCFVKLYIVHFVRPCVYVCFQRCGTVCFCGLSFPRWFSTCLQFCSPSPRCASTRWLDSCPSPSSSWPSWDQFVGGSSPVSHILTHACTVCIQYTVRYLYFDIVEVTRLENLCAVVLFSGAAIAGVYKAAGKRMMSFEALVFGVGQSFCVLVISFLRVLATL